MQAHRALRLSTSGFRSPVLENVDVRYLNVGTKWTRVSSNWKGGGSGPGTGHGAVSPCRGVAAEPSQAVKLHFHLASTSYPPPPSSRHGETTLL